MTLKKFFLSRYDKTGMYWNEAKQQGDEIGRFFTTWATF